MNPIILDVREKDEFEMERVPGSATIPLSQFNHVAPGILKTWAGRNVVILCRSGARAKLAQDQIKKWALRESPQTEVYDGGILAWKKAGQPLVTTTQKSALPIMRQTQLIAGLGILTSTLLAFFVNLKFLYITAFFGAGLSFAGATGFCGMALVLPYMPWNKSARYPELNEDPLVF